MSAPERSRSRIERPLTLLVAIALVAQFAIASFTLRELFDAHEQTDRLSAFHVKSIENAEAIRHRLRSTRQPTTAISLLRKLDVDTAIAAIETTAEQLERLQIQFGDEPQYHCILAELVADVSRLAATWRAAPAGEDILRVAGATLDSALVRTAQFAALHREAISVESRAMQARRAGEIAQLAKLAVLTSLAGILLAIRPLREILKRIKERDQMEESLRQREERIRNIAESSYDIILEVDPRGEIVMSNDRLATILGLEQQAVLSAPTRQLIHPDDFALVHQALAQARANQQPRSVIFRSKHGEGHWLWLEAKATPYRSPTGETNLLVLGHDITAERTAAEARKRLLQIIDHSGDLIAIADMNDQLTYLNETGRELVGLPAGFDISRAFKLQDFAHSRHRERMAESILPELHARGSYEGEILFHHVASGNAIPVHFAGFLLLDEHTGKPIAVATVTRDLSSVKQAEYERARLRDENARNDRLKSLGTMAGSLAHDFNNLLPGVLINAGLARTSADGGKGDDGTNGETPLVESLTRIEDAARQMVGLSNQLLAYAGVAQPSSEPVDLEKLISTQADSLSHAISDDAQLVLELEAGVVAVVNASQIGQLLMNLILNASDSLGGAAGEIRVLLSRASNPRAGSGGAVPADGGVLLEVVDSGCGIGELAQKQIFEPFYSTKKTGRGLGLAAALGIVRAHKGTIHVESQLGKGTRIIVFLPGEQPVAVPGNASARRSETGPARKMKILVVDDETIPRESMALLLKQQGFPVVDAADPSSAIKHLGGDHGDVELALIDLTMPEMSGIELFRRLRGIQPGLRGILCSGYPESHAMSRFADAGFDGFIQKPYEIDALLTMLEGKKA